MLAPGTQVLSGRDRLQAQVSREEEPSTAVYG